VGDKQKAISYRGGANGVQQPFDGFALRAFTAHETMTYLRQLRQGRSGQRGAHTGVFGCFAQVMKA
jgi:hypothetical protein